jgi:hypothetical protein
MSSDLTQLRVYERRDHQPPYAKCFRAAVSMHCHTSHSGESLTFIPHYARRIPVISLATMSVSLPLSLLDQARATPGAQAVTPVAQHVEFGGENALGLRQIDGVDFEDFRRVTSGLLIALFARPALAAWAGLKIEIEVGYTLCAALGGLASSLMGAIYPALRAAGQDAVEALNYE